MFWLPIFLALILLFGWGRLNRRRPASDAIYTLFQTLTATWWSTAPVPLQVTVQRCRQAIQRRAFQAMVSCIGLFLVAFIIIWWQHGEPAIAAIVLLLSAYECYSFYPLINNTLAQRYIRQYWQALTTAGEYALNHQQTTNQD